LAWYTYAFLYFLEPRLRPDFTVFEYGCGNSTFWFAPRVGRVFSVEHQPDWYRYIDQRKPANAQIALAESRDAYLGQAGHFATRYDLIVVDGIHRNDCLALAPDWLTDRGVVILDNSDRPDYAPAIAELLAKGFKKIDFYGMFPVTPLAGTTTVFYRPGNCLDI
jgi:predicted O-methyltransferase YrrM